MKNDYLWDGSGTPDPEVERLERLLATLRHKRPAPELILGEARSGSLRHWKLIAASIVLGLASLWLALVNPRPAWDVVRLNGAPQVGPGRLSGKGRLSVGEALETDASSRAKIRVGRIGEVQVEPNSRIRLVKAGVTEHRLALDRGKIHALISAPPRFFYVDTPSAVAVDLGCAYTLEVDDEGVALLRVSYGWVGFEFAGLESFVPAEAACVTRPGKGPGTPYFEDASARLREALDVFDFRSVTTPQRASALATVLAEARRRDALTVWHLLSRAPDAERGQVFDRMAALVPPPAAVTREGILRRDQQMLDLWWNQLDVGSTILWRFWKGVWPLK
ncbi:MAG: FecR domain-containing protein [Acidobacteriota bacterium]